MKDQNDWYYDHTAAVVVEGDGQTVVADLSPDFANNHCEERRKRIGQQISAAPQLLVALKELLEFAENYGPSERASFTDWSGYFQSAREALQKATQE